jgi:hypothetical protein
MALRRYADAAQALAQWRAVDPTALSPMFRAAKLAEALGDTAGVNRAVQTLRAHGGNLTVTDGDMLRHGGAALNREVEFASLASYPPGTSYDTATFYVEKAELFMSRGEVARARAAIDSGYPAMQHLVDNPRQSPFAARINTTYLGLMAAIRGDRATALAAIRRANASQPTTKYPNSLDKVNVICVTAQIYGALDEVDSMLPYARRCFTAPNGYPLALLREPEFARHMNDPRLRAIARANRD